MTPLRKTPTFQYYEGFARPTELYEILVVGSNLRGRHGAGAALYAARHYGAQEGIGEGLSGNTYLLPTKDKRIKTLPLADIERRVGRFINASFERGDLLFYITPIGTGLAGYSSEDIAPLFRHCNHKNCVLPMAWKPYIDYSYLQTP